MAKRKFIVAGLVLSLFAGGAAYVWFSVLKPVVNIVGTWDGEYLCAQGKTGLALAISPRIDATIGATFDFFPHSSNQNIPIGRFKMQGSIEHDVVNLSPTEWVVQPQGYGMVSLSGIIKNGVITGNVVLPGCTTFTVRKK